MRCGDTSLLWLALVGLFACFWNARQAAFPCLPIDVPAHGMMFRERAEGSALFGTVSYQGASELAIR